MSESQYFDEQSFMLLNSMCNVVSELQTRCEMFEREALKIGQLESKLDSVLTKIGNFEEKCEYLYNRNKMIEENVEQMGSVVHKIIDQCKENISRIETIEQNDTCEKIRDQTKRTEEKLEDLENDIDELKWRSMHNNIVVSGIKLSANDDPETAIKSFLSNRLGVNKNISFTNIHPFGKKNKKGARPIVVKFVSMKDKQLVMKNCYKLKGERFSIREQFPSKIEKKRKELYPALKLAKKQKKKAVLVRDQLYIEGKLHNTINFNEDKKERCITRRNESPIDDIIEQTPMNFQPKPTPQPRRFDRQRNLKLPEIVSSDSDTVHATT